MLFSLAPTAVCLIQRPGGPPHAQMVSPGWHDELSSVSGWGPLSLENKAHVFHSDEGEMLLSLNHVPGGWPYQYQWSGVTRDVQADLGRWPVLMARCTGVLGYAHMDIEVLDRAGKVVKGFRSSTITSAGVSEVDLRASLDPAVYTLRLRLIVGGPNEGCSATYDWVRFVSRPDAQALRAHPETLATSIGQFIHRRRDR